MAEYIKKEAIASKAVYMHGFGKNKYVPLRAIEEAPAADVAPVVHGRWIEAAAYSDGVLNTAYCSVCRNFLPICNWDYHNYCPNCGARMDGD